MCRIHVYHYRLSGSKRWKQPRHRMDAESARAWFARFHPSATYEPVEHGAMDIERPHPRWDGPDNHGGWKTKE